MNGYDFACEAMSVTGYNLDRLVSLCGGLEVDWLEFKAAIQPEVPDHSGSFNEGDYIFNLVKALVSMSNAGGGLVVLGIDDDANAVCLEQSGYKGDKDEFSRHISKKVLHRDGWRTLQNGHMRWKETADQLSFNPRWACFDGQDVLAFEVPPRDQSLGPITLTKSKNKNQEPVEVVYVRAGGDVGMVIPLDGEKAEKWWEARRLDSSGKRFRRWINELQKTDPDTYFAAVNKYCRNVVESTEELSRFHVGIEAEVQLHKDRGRKRGYEADNWYLESEVKSRQLHKWKTDFETIAGKVWPAFLVGEPGSGKSTSFQKIARTICTKHSKDAQRWALVVPLSGLYSAGLRELVIQEIPELNWSDILLALESGDLTLFLDGLNECPTRHYESCLNEVADLLQQFPEARVFVSTRRSHLPDYALQIIELRSMSSTTQRAFVENHIGHDSELLSSFWEAVREKPTGGLIASNPMMLRMSVSLWEEVGELPEGLAMLYDKFFDTCIKREAHKDLDAMVSNIWTEEEVKEHLALLAFSMRCDGLVSCSRKYAEEKLKIALGERASSFLDRFKQGFFINSQVGGKSLRFSHETVQEFLAAVFIAHHPDHDLLQPDGGAVGSQWYMPIVFAFEMFEQPPEHFIRAAWELAPLLVCASMRDSERLKLLPEPIGRHHEPQNDLWVRGIVRSLRGESTVDVTQGLSFRGRTPSPGRRFQKHPLPVELVSVLESMPFWYAMGTFVDGRERLERLQHLLIDRRNLWIELLPHAVSGQPDWVEQLSDPQKIIVGELQGVETSEALEVASVLELCYMIRNKLISEADFRQHWKRALNVDNQQPLAQELLALLTTKIVKADQFNGKQRAVLKDVGSSLELSPRILHTLVCDRLVNSDDLRQDYKKIKRLADSVSPIRAKQLVRDRVLRPADFNENQKKMLIERIETTKDIVFVLDSGIVKSRKEIPENILNRVYEGKESKDRKVKPETKIGADQSRQDASHEELESIYKSKEEMLIQKIRREIEDPENFLPGNGYHRLLAEHIEGSFDWSPEVRMTLIDMAEKFFREHKSKKRFKEHMSLITTVRESIEGGVS